MAEALPAFSFFRRLTVRYGSNERLTYRVFMPEFTPREWKLRKKLLSFFHSSFLSFSFSFLFFSPIFSFEKISPSRIIYLHCRRAELDFDEKFRRPDDSVFRVLKTSRGAHQAPQNAPFSPSPPLLPPPSLIDMKTGRRGALPRVVLRHACDGVRAHGRGRDKKTRGTKGPERGATKKLGKK